MSPPNVLYLTVDSLRADRVGHLGYDRPTTPTLDRLADRGTTCEHAYANGIPTYYSFKSLLGGLPSLGHSPSIGLPAGIDTIATAFRDRGYETAGFNAGNPWLTREYGYHRGFETYRDFLTDDDNDGLPLGRTVTRLARRAKPVVESSDFLADRAGHAARTVFSLAGHTPLEPAETVTETALEWLAAREDDRPFFLWLHYMDPHYPWVPPRAHRDRFCATDLSRREIGALWHQVSTHNGTNGETDPLPEDALRRIGNLYDAEVRRTDDAIGRVLASVEESAGLDSTLVCVVGDHGTELQDHGSFSHGPRALYDEIIAVPLVFAGPDVPDRTVSNGTSLLDVPTTILELTGADHIPSHFVGRSAFEQRSATVTEVPYDHDPTDGDPDTGLLRACIDWPWKLIENDELGTRELYHLGEDPDEVNDRSSDRPSLVQELGSTLERHRTDVERRNRTLREKSRVRSTLSSLKAAGKI